MREGERFKTEIVKSTDGFTLIELLVAVALGLVVIGAIYMTFSSQQDSYIVQTQISATQQNLRGATYRLTQDIQMAGHYTNFVREDHTMNWDWLGEDEESIKPVIYGRHNVTGEAKIKDGSDILVVVLADRSVTRPLSATENIPAGDTTTVPGSVRNIGLNDGYYGLLVKKNLNRAEMFKVTGAEGTDFNVTLNDDYGEDDLIFRVDIFRYFIDENSNLCVINLARKEPNKSKQTVAENIENLKVRYILNDGTSVNNIEDGTQVKNVRAVEVSILGRTAKAIKGYTDTKTYSMAGVDYDPGDKNYQRRLYSTTILTRNIGL